jgi:cytochrome o ubiquinol oxidase operon protein cyoD
MDLHLFDRLLDGGLLMDMHHGWYVSFKPLFVGLIASLILLAVAFIMVVAGDVEKAVLYPTLFGLACLQALVQLIFFMHLGIESKPRWNVLSFVFLIFIMIIIVGGSIWIMNNLNYNMMYDMGPN